ncbi:MAG: hypothetical protein FJY65_03750 [Calditrichaeota bacterium]|nr:hypothetical protein [Calditrichota bacterium]
MKKTYLITSAALIICGLHFYNHLEAKKTTDAGAGVIFPHKYHIEEVGVECSLCHKNAQTSDSGLERLLPEMSVCADCHNVEDETGCTLCHKDPTRVRKTPSVGGEYAVFSHKLHIAKQTCKDCHPVQAGVSLTGRLYPDMHGCADCHQARRLELKCSTCHIVSIPPKPASHRFDWKKIHGDEALADASGCAMCHQVQARDDCAKCHQGAGFVSPHPQKFNHSLSYTRGMGFADCQTCHEPESFCSACHIQKMVMPSNHSRPGWASRTGGGGAHSRQAEADFDYCVICHTNTVSQPSCFTPGCHQ